MGVRGVLCPCGASGTRAARGQVTADSLLGHIIGQTAAAGARCWRGASAVEKRAETACFTEDYYAVMRFQALSLGDVTMRSVQLPGMPLAKAKRGLSCWMCPGWCL